MIRFSPTPDLATSSIGYLFEVTHAPNSVPTRRQTAPLENGFVHLPESAPWLTEYLHEMTVFPQGRQDDQVDATA